MWDSLNLDILELILSRLNVFDSCHFAGLSKQTRAVRKTFVSNSQIRWNIWEADEPGWTCGRDVWMEWLFDEPEVVANIYMEQIMAKVRGLIRKGIRHQRCRECGCNIAPRLRKQAFIHSDVETRVQEGIVRGEWARLPNIEQLAHTSVSALACAHRHDARCFRLPPRSDPLSRRSMRRYQSYSPPYFAN